MAKQEAGNWAPYNAKAIVDNVRLVFKTRDINKLNGTAYHFITLHMGFIAHYSVNGFRATYANLDDFARTLQTSEYSDNRNYNMSQANRQESDGDFDKWYGAAYNESIAEAIRGIVDVARAYEGSGIVDKAAKSREYRYSVSPRPVSRPRSNTRRQWQNLGTIR